MMKSPLYSLYISYLLISFAFECTFGLANNAGEGSKVSNQTSRRSFFSSASAISSFLAIPQVAKARFILNEETGKYDEVKDEDWQTAWGKRLDKAKTMTTDEIFLAAQGASNLDSKLGEESEVSKKRRALAGCRNDNLRKRSGMKDTKECTAKVLGGEFQFMIDAMTTN